VSQLTPLLCPGCKPGHHQLKHSTCDSSPTQQSGCSSQTSTVPELLSAHSDGVVDSTVNVSYGPCVNIRCPVLAGFGRIVKIPVKCIRIHASVLFCVSTELSRFVSQPESVAVVEGETARFQCLIHGVPRPAVSWMKDGRPLAQSDR